MTIGSHQPKPVLRVDQIKQLSDEERSALVEVSRRFAFRSNDYYLSLIDWNDPHDPIRRSHHTGCRGDGRMGPARSVE